MRTKLSEKYQEEREKICEKILEIVKLDTNKCFLLCELDNNVEKQEKLLEMKKEIQKYFACSTISSFKPNFNCKRPYLNIIRSILKKQNYTIKGDDIFHRKEDGNYIKTMKYKIFREN